MTKGKRIFAAAVAAVSIGAVGITAFAAHWDYFSFSL